MREELFAFLVVLSRQKSEMGVSGLVLQAGAMPEVVDSIVNNIGIDMFDEEIDDVIFQTNEFLTDATFIGASGPFWWLSDITSFGTSKPSVNQLLGNLSRETNALGETKTGQNRKKSYLTICLVLPSFQTSRLQVQSYEIVPI